MMSVGERIARFAREAAILPGVRSASQTPTVRRGFRKVVLGVAVPAAAVGLGMAALIAVFPASGRTATAATPYPTPALKWDVSMSDQTPIPAIKCPMPVGNQNGNIDPGESPNVTNQFWIQPAGGTGGTQAMFDRANVIWTTGPLLGGDVTAPRDGLAAKRVGMLGAKVGMVSISIQSNLLPVSMTTNGIDDIIVPGQDSTVTGQPPRCGADVTGDGRPDTLALADSFELWNAAFHPDDSDPIIDYWNAQTPDSDGGGYPSGCDSTGNTANHACAPRAVRGLPRPILALETAMGLTPASRVSRAYGIAKLPIVGGITDKVDVNFLVYSLHDKGTNGYLSITLIQYPGLPSADPTYANYNPLSQSVQTCPPYWSSATICGVTSNSDFDEDGKPDLSVTTPEINRTVVCNSPDCAPGKNYDYNIETSMAADYDGDGIPAYADRCRTDPASGSATPDADGDALTGTCDTNGEGTNPKVGDWNSKPPWDSGQDVDADGYLNYVDNCPNVYNPDQKDTDGDSVGDACDPAPTIPGDGHGYANPAPGMFVDYGDVCRDPWTVGLAEPSGDGQCGAIPGWQDSNDDGVPDYVALPGGSVLKDCVSDSDHDGFVDAVEAAPSSVQPCAPSNMTSGKSSDPLDPSSPGAGPVGGSVGGIEEPPDKPGSSAGSSGGPPLGVLTVVAVLAAGALLCAAGGQYSRKRWRG